MIIVTNRELIRHKNGDVELGSKPNVKGPLELRLLLADRSINNKWIFSILSNRPSHTVKSALIAHGYDVQPVKPAPRFTSEMVAHAVWNKACAEKKSILFYVHGYNNDVVSLAESCEKLEKLYNVIVVGFS